MSQTWNDEEHNACEKYDIWNATTSSCENVEHLTSAIKDSVIMCDEIINDADTLSKNVPINVINKFS